MLKVHFGSPRFLNALGQINYNTIVSNPFVVYITEFEKEQEWIATSESYMERIQMLFFVCGLLMIIVAIFQSVCISLNWGNIH